MSILKNKIDFEVIVAVDHANPNGDPLNGNRPRTTEKYEIDYSIWEKTFLYSQMIGVMTDMIP